MDTTDQPTQAMPPGWYPHPSTGTTRYWDGSEWGAPPAGWYPHPSMADTKRYWDGTDWTDHIAPVTVAPTPPRDTSFDLGWSQRQPATPEPDHGGLIVAGYMTAVLLPLVGFIIGIVLLAKGKTGHGLGAMILSVLAFLFWANLLSAASAPTYDYGY